MKVLILGGNGQVGSALKAYAQTHLPHLKITATQRQPAEGYTVFDPFKDDWRQLGQYDCLINAIGIIEEKPDNSFEKVHVKLVQKILEHRAALGDPRIIQISALGAGPQHPAPFLSSKDRGDALLLGEKNTLVLRPSIICTPNTMLIRKLLFLQALLKRSRGWLFAPATLLQTHIQPVMMEDVAAAVFAPQQLEGVFELCGPEQYTLKELLRYAYLDLKIIPVPAAMAAWILRSNGWFRRLISPGEFQLLQQDNVSSKQDLSKLLGRAPKPTRPFFIQALLCAHENPTRI